MKTSERQALMHAVLDGEATPEEARELERRLGADPAARAEFEQWRCLFEGLAAIPEEFPPEGLVASVMANLPTRARPRGGSDQPFVAPRVIGQASNARPGVNPGTTTTDRRASPTGPFFRGESMSEQQVGSKRKVWIGVGVAVAAVVVASQFVDFGSGGKDPSIPRLWAVRNRSAGRRA